MAVQLRLRQLILLSSSSIPSKCYSITPIASDSTHINLSKTLLPAPSRHENPRHYSRPHHLQPETKIPRVEIYFPKFSKTSPWEKMVEICFQNLAQVLASADDAKVVEKVFKQMCNKLKKCGLEMLEQLKEARMREERSVEDENVMEEMVDKLKKSGFEMIELLKDYIEKAKATRIPRKGFLSEEMLERLYRFKDYVEMTETTNKPKKSRSHITFSPLDIKLYKAAVANLKAFYGATWRKHVFDIDKVKLEKPPRRRTNYYQTLALKISTTFDATEHNLTHMDIAIMKKTVLESDPNNDMEQKMASQREYCISLELLTSKERLNQFKEYVEMMETTHMPEQSDCSSLHNSFSPEHIFEYEELIRYLKDNSGETTWRSKASDVDELFERFSGFRRSS